MSWYITVMKKYAVFSGRARRKEYWMFFLFNLIISFTLGLVCGFAGSLLGLGTQLSSIVSGAYTLAIIVPSVAVVARRMHDLGRSGWWMLVPVANVVFLLMAGQVGENEYGPDPKEGEAA